MNETIAYLGLIEDEAILLDAAAIELAALDHPGVELKPYVALLNRMVTQLGSQHGDCDVPRERAEALSAVIVGHYGFRGDSQHYDDPANADPAVPLGQLVVNVDGPQHWLALVSPVPIPQPGPNGW